MMPGMRRELLIVGGSLLAAIGCVGGAPSLEATSATHADSIVLERTACFGDCPAYRVSVVSSGRVTLSPRPGYRGQVTMQPAVDSISPESFTSLLSLAESTGFFTLPDSTRGHPVLCTRLRTDHPSLMLAVHWAATSKRVTHYTGCEGNGAPGSAEPLRRLEMVAEAVDREARTSRHLLIR
jgi:hypothetical protein